MTIFPRQPSKWEKAFSGISSGIHGAARGAQAFKEAMQEKKARNQFSVLFPTYSEQFSPEFAQKLLLGKEEGEIKSQLQQSKAELDELSLPDFDTVKEFFGPEFAEIYKVSPTGGKSELIKWGVESLQRGSNISDILKNEGIINESSEEDKSKIEPYKTRSAAEKNEVELPGGEEFQYPKIEYPKGLLPKELQTFKKETRSFNSPIYRENNNKIRGLQGEKDRIEILQELNPLIPKGAAKFFQIDKNGNIRPYAQYLGKVPPEVERYSKTLNDFLVGAKEIFGSRVTNYDIQAFKARLPSLMNSEEGRAQILEQMKALNEIESNFREALKKVYNHYGLDKINEEQAVELAEQMTEDREQELRDELKEKIGKTSSQDNDRPSLEEIFG